MPRHMRTAWAGSIVEASRVAVVFEGSPLEPLAATATERFRHNDGDGAYDMFQAIRQQRLLLRRGEDLEASTEVLELACKVAYNETSPSAPFDADSGRSLVQSAASLARRFPDREDALWAAICRRG